jgi:ubiquinone/menaquinone biosynthesis C-methylase UbiE
MSSSKKEVVGLFSRAAPTYDSVGPRHFTYFAGRLVEFVRAAAGNQVLDVATGTGAVLLAAAERCGPTGYVVGVDLVAAMLARAATAIRRRSLQQAEVCAMDAEHLAFRGKSFDTVLCSFAFLSFPHQGRVLDEFRRVLKPAGALGLLDAFGWFFQHDRRWRWQEDVLRAFGALPNDGEREYGPSDLVQTVQRAGFAAVELVEDTCALVFHDEEEWWRWVWSHGSRRLVEAVSPAQRDELKRELVRGLPNCREGDGLIHGRMRAVLVRARQP